MDAEKISELAYQAGVIKTNIEMGLHDWEQVGKLAGLLQEALDASVADKLSYSPKPTFIAKCLTGEATPEEINDYIDQWHKGQSALSLQDFLGLTEDEHVEWLKNNDALAEIIQKRREEV